MNLGKLIADGGRIGIHAGLISQAGSLSADRAEVGPGGEISLRGTSIDLAPTSRISAGGSSGGKVTVEAGDGVLSVAGSVAATGRDGGGGAVRLLGRDVRLSGAAVDASGGGGRATAARSWSAATTKARTLPWRTREPPK